MSSRIALILLAVPALLAAAAAPALAQAEYNVLDAFEGHANVTATIEGDTLFIQTNGLPDHATQQVNPNTPRTADYTLEMPLNPEYSLNTTPTGMGAIGVMVNGVLFYNPYTADGLDAVEHEVFDNCLGHPDQMGRYHYHQAPGCLLDGTDGQLIGFAFDGFPLYSYTDEDGSTPTDLDECNGHFTATPEYANGIYHYHVTDSFPYLIGCYHGDVQIKNLQETGGGGAGAGQVTPPTGNASAGNPLPGGPAGNPPTGAPPAGRPNGPRP
ncbi:MAG: YHYH protein [Anaerolineae bacterium]|nr:MAG: YHYH protein [Anaerolineae bacterium]